MLIIDDDTAVLTSCQRIFTEEGFAVTTTTNPVEGLELATRKEYTVILCDWHMPELDGMDVVAKLETDAPESAVVMISGYNNTLSQQVHSRTSYKFYDVEWDAKFSSWPAPLGIGSSSFVVVTPQANKERGGDRCIFRKKEKLLLPIIKSWHILIASILLGLVTFIARFEFPLFTGSHGTNFNLGHFPQYIFLFALGVIAAKYGSDHLVTLKQAKKWMWFSVALIFIGFPLLFFIISSSCLTFCSSSLICLLYFSRFFSLLS